MPHRFSHWLIITFHEKGNLQPCQIYRTVSPINQFSKVMLKAILIRIEPQAEDSGKMSYLQNNDLTAELKVVYLFGYKIVLLHL